MASSVKWSASTDEEEKRIIDEVGGLQISSKSEPQAAAPPRAMGRGRGLASVLRLGGDGVGAPSVGAPSVPGSSVGAPSMPGLSVGAPSISGSSVGAPSMPASSVETPSMPAQSVEAPSMPTQSVEAPLAGGPSPPMVDGQPVTNDDGISAEERSLLSKILRNNLVSTKHDVEIQRSDQKSPLYSAYSFEELPLRPELLRGVQAMGFHRPSKIQAATLPSLITDPVQNIIAQSQSGTGKTASFVLTMLSRVDPSMKCPQALCLSPTLELALQIGEVVKTMGKFCPEITMRFVVRGEEFQRGQKISDHIIIGTPGKVLDWVSKYRVVDLKNMKVFVLDEADVMIAMQGHQDQSLRIHKFLPFNCQMLLFSATYDDEIMDFASKMIKNPIVMRLRRDEESVDNIKQYYIKCNSKEQKYQAITNIYGTITVGQAIIFCQTRNAAAWLAGKMVKDGHTVGMLSGELTTEERIDVLSRFRDGKEKVLITTNVMSRGIDIEQVTLVINYDLPVDRNGRADCETYLHRIGRTGRFGKSGIAINLVDSEQSLSILRDIEQHFGRRTELLDAEDADDIEKLNE